MGATILKAGHSSYMSANRLWGDYKRAVKGKRVGSKGNNRKRRPITLAKVGTDADSR